MLKVNYYLFLILASLVLMISCNKDDVIEPDPKPEPETEPETEEVISEEIKTINKWIYDVMDEVYLWEEELPRSIDYAKEPDSEAYFEKMRYDEDKWSWITDDYEAMSNSSYGISKSFGFDFSLFLKESGSSAVVGIVNYVVSDGPADNAGVRRGHVFEVINGISMTTENYRSALEGDLYKLELMVFGDMGKLVADSTVTINAIELDENPFLTYSVIDTVGIKIGYVCYNSYNRGEQDSTLMVDVFSDLKSQGIQELVLDLRYNGGGSDPALIQLMSIIAPMNNVSSSDIFLYENYNDLLTTYFRQNDPDRLFLKFDKNVAVNLDLKRLYVIAQNSTASASEATMHCLRPFMEVIHVGENTYGKYTGMFFLDDLNDGNTHAWGIAPIVSKYSDINRVSDFVDGLEPQIEASDDVFHELGDPEEGMLATALSDLLGTPAIAYKSVKTRTKQFVDHYPVNLYLKDGVLVHDFSFSRKN